MTIADLISNLKQLDIRLSAEGERLRVNAPKGVLTQGLRTQIAERKHELLQFLSDYEQSTALIPAPIIPRSSTGPAPLSFAQERLWFLEQLEPGNAVYNICRAWRLLGELNLSAIEASLNAIVRRHEVLRSSIRVAEGRPLQGVQPPFELNLFVLDLQAALDIERECEMAERIEQATEAPFDFAAGKFLRAELLRVAANEHVLILTTHHIVSDAWSMGILTRELWSLYVKYAAGKSSQLEELPVQYGDFAAWQREWLQGEVLERQVSYWKEQLKDLSHLNLPTDRPRSARQSFQAARSPITLPETLTTAIHELSDQAGVTPFMILLAAFQVLLYRYCGQEEIVVGSPIANRARTELEPLIGFFVNTLVLRSDLSGNPAFEELLARVREVCLGAYAHQDLPFEKLVQELQPERDPSRNPLFQVMLALQNATRPVSGIPDLRIEPLEIESTRSPFDLSVLLRERDGKYTGSIVYSTDLFNRDRIERMVRHFQTLLEGIIANPDQPISTLPILTDSERHQILIEWNDTAADYPRDSCIHELFEAQVERTPEAIAVHFEGKQLTYWELNVRANQLAHYLRGLGVGPEKLVGICVERSLEMVVGLLGILKAGGAYVPLDETYPTERLRFMLEDAQVSVLLTQRKVIEHGRWGMANGEPRSSMLDSQTIKVVYLHTIWETIAQESERNLRREVKSGSLAYLIYTSGSSGQPKGVMIPHRAICNHVSWMQTAFPLNNSDRVLGHASLCFDASVWELFVPLSNGARLVLAQQGSHQDLAYLVKLMAEEKVTVLQSVPSLLQMLLEENIECCTSLRHVFCGGEVLSGELLDRCFARLPGKLHNHYGPTEATIDATSWTCAGANDRHLVPIGRPIANTQVYILDSHIQPVPVGVPGELHIGGDGLARGYLNAPQLTAEKFISNPFSKEFGARLYKTGDLGRYLPNGHIEFSGRMDNQVKLRGYRIELPEIEKVLVQHPGVRDSVVLLQERTPRNKRLVAYVASKKERAPTVSELRTYVAEKLPAYMVPAVYVMLDAIPFLPNGKVDRQALPPPGDNAPGANETFVEPRTEVEKLLADIWLEVLHLERLGVHDNFFELGGHSLLAIQVISRAREIFHNGVSLRSLFRAPTVAGLAETIEGTIRGVSEIDLPTIDPVPRDRTLPLSMNQEQLWTLDQMMPDTRFFNIPLMYRIGGDLNTEALEKSLKEIIRRHEVLRTVFVQVDGRPVQVIKEGSSFELPLIDLRGITSDNQVNQLSSLILEERERSFDLAIGPLLRTKLVRLADRDYFFFLTAHHIVGDDWSMQLFRNELAVLYCAFSQGRPSPLPEPTIQFADYACWERRLIENGLFDEKLAYWRKQLSGPAPALDFEEKGIREKALSVRASEPIAVDETLYKGIKTLARRESCTVFMVLLTALNGLLHRYAHQQDIRIGALVANRGRREVEGLIGYFLNTVVLCTQVSPEMTIQQLLLQVRAVTLAAYIHQEVPFEQVARMLEQEENINRSSLFQVLFNYQGPAAESIQIPGLTFASLNFQEPTGGIELAPTMFDLIFDVRESSTKLSGSVNYKTGLFVNGVTCVIRDFRRILETMISEPKCRLSSISLD